ncbi:hypothetical protein HPB48_016642 [Haemaphysalis longicornis]|uniref:Elongation of very long chain fatty acids protein n=1 Tax=Haemaphysalis longicornis TaxID=44386 RepID=A0A9J6FNH4_HAELO|nr:hypothetical protein HPB48_016642 [Haemaphysalis longicornis]
MGSPAVVLLIIAGYNYFSLRLGPELMKNRRPLSIRPVVLAYNALNVFLSVYFFATMLQLTYLRGTVAGSNGLPPYSLFCEGTDNSSNGIPFLNHLWLYMLTKIAEMMDTVFFVLLKKNSHISFLHVFHHSIAFSTVWLVVNNGITGQTAMFPVLNSVVHTVMYAYYGLSALPPSLRPNLLVEAFVILAFHGAVPLFYDCGFPRAMAWIITTETVLFTWLFSRLCYQTYMLRKAD